ncbi:hypothetical protein H310_03155 [Aphanomyces invadans]|uniref:Uncharacterized protein n=1 Tax=Aphanomyces invadans TaxID=157072 RepID=A0A024UMJ9_9STRA|nr:hypothetical protein H310_03155 [Aphanomyces invadans]ETW07082.1 hypothetical protein H310_03155 [Aphanomyces invadans]|eukprot:XP_008865157.1 hypothetical protein H310_03155 [Aphanomyces invadans]
MMKLFSELYGIKFFMGESYLFQNQLEIRIRHTESARAYGNRFKIHLDEVFDAGMTIDDKLQVHIFLNSLDEWFESFINFQAHVFQHGEAIDGTTLPKLFTALIQKEIRSISPTATYATKLRMFAVASLPTSSIPTLVNGVPNNTAPPVDSAATASSERLRGSSSQASSGPNRRRYGQSSVIHVSMLANVSHFTLQSSAPLPDVSPEWIMDSGASDHYCNNAAWFEELRPCLAKLELHMVAT